MKGESLKMTQSLLAASDFAHARLLGSLEAITRFPEPAEALAFRPGVGRAHCAWQFMHIAATLDKYVHFIQGRDPGDPELITRYGGGSTPSDERIPSVEEIRSVLERDFALFRGFIAAQTADTLAQQVNTPGNRQRTIQEAIVLLTWHDTHHQGQIHLTLNMYKASKGL